MRLEALQKELRLKRERLREQKPSYVKALLPDHYVPQHAAAEFFRTATPDPCSRRATRSGVLHIRRKTLEGPKRQALRMGPHTDQRLSTLPDSTATNLGVSDGTSHRDYEHPDQSNSPGNEIHGTDEEDYGSRNPRDRPNWTQADGDPVEHKLGLRTLVAPFLRHMPSKPKMQAINVSAKSKVVNPKTSSSRRRKSISILFLRQHRHPAKERSSSTP